MPVYTYRREDGTTFDYRQKFLDDPLEVCPTTGQRVVRVIHAPGIIFKGSGFYVNDSKDSSKSAINGASNGANGHAENGSSGSTSESEAKSEKTETKSEKKEAAKSDAKAAAD
ncbi:MAG: hypothetical protein D6737_17755 [Chloroflexi bacterium]|nr:MAG: hypothetical protein D6737_17755 [Chloroflexota bacterium]